MINQELEKKKSCAITGHRHLEENFSKALLVRYLESIINEGYENFYVGMAVGFDIACFIELVKLRKKHPIKLIACIPCPEQPLKYSEKQKQLYYDLVSQADYKYVLSEKYTPYCMQNRNMFMVDNSSLVFAYIKRQTGGTFNTVNYAIKTGVQVICYPKI